jgi:hypothetical protein
MSATEAHRELCAAIYGQNVMSDGGVRQRCGNSAECSNMGERTNVYDEERSGRPSVVSDDIVQIVDQKWNCEKRFFTLTEVSCEFPQISRIILYDIIIVRLGYHKFCARWVPKMLEMQRMSSTLAFVERYHKESYEFLIHIVRDDETWVSFVNIETKEQSKQ